MTIRNRGRLPGISRQALAQRVKKACLPTMNGLKKSLPLPFKNLVS